MKKCGIKYGESIERWLNKNNDVLSVSATPYAHVIATKLNEKAFEEVVLPINDHYYSLQHMQQDGRAFQSKAIVENEKVTRFFVERMEEFVKSCVANGNGHLVIRATGSRPEVIKQYLSENYPAVDVQVFESIPVSNLSTLDDTLSESYPKPLVVIIKGTLRAGKTLTTTKNIRMWIDSSTSKEDSMCQSVGRCLGFEMVGGRNRKFDDKFPVYCNITWLDIALKFYTDRNCVPRGIGNKTNVSRKQNSVRVAKWDDIPTEYRSVNKRGRPAATAVSASGSKKGAAKDLLRSILNGEDHGAGTNTPHIHIDAPHPRFRDTWEEAIALHPEWITGEYFTYRVPEKEQRLLFDKNLIDPKHIFSKPERLTGDAA